MSVRVAVLGASGYTAGELLRVLVTHPEMEVTAATSREYVGKPITRVHPHLRGFYPGLRFTSIDLDRMGDVGVVFLSLPAGIALGLVPRLYALLGRLREALESGDAERLRQR